MTADLLQRTLDTAELVIEQAKLKPERPGRDRAGRRLDADAEGAATLQEVTRPGAVPGHFAAYVGGPGRRHPRRDPGSQIPRRQQRTGRTGSASMLNAVKQEDVNSHGLGIVARNPKTGKKINHVMIRRNTALPTEVQADLPHQRRRPARVTSR